MSVLKAPFDPATVVVAVAPGKVMNRVWASHGTGWLEQPMSVPVSCAGVEQLQRLLDAHHPAVAPVIAIEATGSLHQAFVADLERRFPGSTRLFAPSENEGGADAVQPARFGWGDSGGQPQMTCTLPTHDGVRRPVRRHSAATAQASRAVAATRLSPMTSSRGRGSACR